jgi:hypothetical protein
VARLSGVEQRGTRGRPLTQKGAGVPLNLELPVTDQGVSTPISMVSSAEEDGDSGGRSWTVVVVRNSKSVSR